MSTTSVVAPRGRQLAARLLGAACVATWLVVLCRIVMLPANQLTGVMADDAMYYAVPARHWWQGNGFSFDGLEPTNGVQTLWALVVLVFAGVCDDSALLHAMVAGSALSWGLAAFLLYRWLLPRSFPAALLAGAGFAWCGMHGHLALQGMDNGLHALVGMWVLVAGSRCVTRGWRRTDVLVLGIALATFALSRTEAVLLGVVLGAAIVLGLVDGDLPRRRRLQITLLLAAPGLALVGGAAVASKLAFGTWLPVSGHVKAFYEQQWAGADVHGGVLGTLAWHVRFVTNLALSPLREDLSTTLATCTATGIRLWRNLMWAALAFTVGAALWRWWRTRKVAVVCPPRSRFARVVAAYAVVHLLVMAIALPHFTEYGTWYFATEATVVWLGIGLVLHGTAARASWLVVAVAVGITVAGVAQNARVAPNRIDAQLHRAGTWIAANVPDGEVIGTLCSGFIAWHARDHHVVNLDGLVNTQRYLDEVLRPARLAEYFDEKGIRWFADYAPIQSWGNGVNWQGWIAPDRLVPRRYDRIDEKSAYLVCQVLPRGDSFALLGNRCDLVRDRHVELAVAAEVHGRFSVIAQADLANAMRLHADHVVARSLLATPSDQLLHVLAPRTQLATIAMTDATVHPDHPDGETVAPGVVLLGHDTTTGRVQDRDFIAVTLFWSCRKPPHGGETFVLLLLDGERHELDRQPVGTCHGTLPCAEWPVGSVVPETVVLRAPLDAKVHLVLRRGDGSDFALTP